MEWTAFQDTFESFVGVNIWTMLFAWANLLILYLVLKKILFVPIKNMIDSRQAEIDGMYENAEAAESTANRLRCEYESKIEKASEESEEILKNAVRKAQLREEEILKNAEAQARRTLERAEEEIKLERKRAVNDIKDEVSGIAIEIAEAIIERDIKPEEHSALIDDFISNMGDGQ